jgi:hypothetical protein
MKHEESLHTEKQVLATDCIHLQQKIIKRISRGIPFDKRPDLILWVCYFPLPCISLVQCPVIVKGTPCPHEGPYSRN